MRDIATRDTMLCAAATGFFIKLAPSELHNTLSKTAELMGLQWDLLRKQLTTQLDNPHILNELKESLPSLFTSQKLQP